LNPPLLPGRMEQVSDHPGQAPRKENEHLAPPNLIVRLYGILECVPGSGYHPHREGRVGGLYQSYP